MSALAKLKPVAFTEEDAAVIEAAKRAERSEETRREIAAKAIRYTVGK